MRIFPILRRVLAVISLIAIVTLAYFLWARPYQLRWGATDTEAGRTMPGDELDPHPSFLATRAITIEGTPEEIWPWLFQMGYGRAGFYGYDILENLGSPRGIRSADQIVPQFQHFKVGDEVPISPVASMVFFAIEPGRYLIWSGKTVESQSCFTWALYPVDGSHTRLVSRIRWHYHWKQPNLLVLEVFTEFTDHLAVRKILSGVKSRVEGGTESFARQSTEFAIFVISALIFMLALIALGLRPITWQRWLASLAVGVAWLIIWYPPSF